MRVAARSERKGDLQATSVRVWGKILALIVEIFWCEGLSFSTFLQNARVLSEVLNLPSPHPLRHFSNLYSRTYCAHILREPDRNSGKGN